MLTLKELDAIEERYNVNSTFLNYIYYDIPTLIAALREAWRENEALNAAARAIRDDEV